MTKAKPIQSRRSTKVTKAAARNSSKPAPSKTQMLIGLLQRADGITIPDDAKKLGWQPHSVRGVISGVLKTKQGLKIEPVADSGIPRRYRIA